MGKWELGMDTWENGDWNGNMGEWELGMDTWGWGNKYGNMETWENGNWVGTQFVSTWYHCWGVLGWKP